MVSATSGEKQKKRPSTAIPHAASSLEAGGGEPAGSQQLRAARPGTCPTMWCVPRDKNNSKAVKGTRDKKGETVTVTGNGAGSGDGERRRVKRTSKGMSTKDEYRDGRENGD